MEIKAKVLLRVFSFGDNQDTIEGVITTILWLNGLLSATRFRT